ncbi:L-fuculose-phosphate aldolase [Duganella sp. SG902]|uniref:class II aldolase/adducin family protein n=1 Tax=Duganella sp. SG902 TaxID=2587016 RepID=UPI00159D1DF5|nr:class II aldolase/adducin family protein [Duganella sp. SG902]NVM77530.1 L-fuculose-phosphate aldolase [Duganella sp. SG902]
MFAHEERERIVEICLDLSRRGYLAGTGGNIALRIDRELFAVTPSATDYFSMRAADVCVVRLSDLRQIEGERAPSVETGLHASVLRVRPDVRCSIHTHQPIASAYALLNQPLDARDEQERHILGPRIPVVGYMPSGSGLLTRLVRRALRRDVNAYLMRNHGVLCCGPTISQTVRAVEALERLAEQRLIERITQEANIHPARSNAFRRLLAAMENS